jgi:hypothetical protein
MNAAHALQRRAPFSFPNLTAESLPRVTLACVMLSWSDTCQRQTIPDQNISSSPFGLDDLFYFFRMLTTETT